MIIGTDEQIKEQRSECVYTVGMIPTQYKGLIVKKFVVANGCVAFSEHYITRYSFKFSLKV